MKTVGSRMPLQEDHNLWRLEQRREHVCTEQRGHVYLGASMWQMVQSDESRGSSILGQTLRSRRDREALTDRYPNSRSVGTCGLAMQI
jgi:hypothetical protein